MGNLDIQTGICQAGSTVYVVNLQQSNVDNYRTQGLITIGYETRLIISSTGFTVTVAYPFVNIPTGNYSVQSGCDKSDAMCAIHGQQINYSGFKNVPFEISVKS
jgi:hypothetical protein